MRRRSAVLAVLLLAFAFVLAAAAWAQPAIDPAGLVAYVDPDGRPAVVDPATADVASTAPGGVERARFPAWSGDGNALAAIISDLGGGRVDLVDVMGPERRVAVTGIDAFAPRATLPNPGAFQSPALSDDERDLAYATIVDGARSVAVVPNPERPDLTGDAVPRTLPHRGQAALAWRPGRAQLAV